MAEEKKFHVGVKGMIENSAGQVLLMKEDVSNHSLPTSEYWDFPGGRMQEDETVIQTLRREIEEETGITEVREPEFVTAVISNHQIKLKAGEIVGLVLMVYEVQIDPEAEIKLSHEHLDYEWVSRAEAKKRLAHKYPEEFTDRL
ncbi:MAG TPA: NUDIX hydrolase [Candidatus Saccharimonadales bacterium]|nr:NUDIX hydrolase [Candidatus Saccharimonadales bacterium]